MADKILTIPNDSTLPIKVNDNLYIQVSSQCQWCYSDPTPCFSGGLLAAGQYNQTTGGFKYGPYPATAAGTVNFGLTNLSAMHHNRQSPQPGIPSSLRVELEGPGFPDRGYFPV